MLNVYLVYELNNWLNNPTNNYTLKSWLFDIVKLTRNTIKSNFADNGQGIAFDDLIHRVLE